MKKILLLLVAMISIYSVAWAQKTVSGIVKDQTGPLESVSITEKGMPGKSRLPVRWQVRSLGARSRAGSSPWRMTASMALAHPVVQLLEWAFRSTGAWGG